MSDNTLKGKTIVVMGPLLPVPEAPAGEPDLCTVGDLRPDDVAEAAEDLHGTAGGMIPAGAIIEMRSRVGGACFAALVVSREGVALRVGLTGKVRRLRSAPAAQQAPAPADPPEYPPLPLDDDEPYPLRDVLRILADAADHLLHDHDCDGHGWEVADTASRPVMDPIQKSIWRHARRARPAAELRLEDVVVRLCRGLVVLGRAHTVGPYTPAVPDPAGYAWCVMDRGGPVVLAHDAFEAATWFLRAERYPLEGYEVPIRLLPDAEQAERDREADDARRRWFDVCDSWLLYRRYMAQRPAARRRAAS